MIEFKENNLGRADFGEVSEKFFKLEKDLNLLDSTIKGVRYWELIRFKVHRDLKRSLGITGQAHTSLGGGLYGKANYVRKAINNIFSRNPFIVSEHDIMFYGHQRRKKRNDNKWWDIYSDPVIEELNEDHIYYESSYLGKHLTPAKTPNIKYMDLLNFLGTIRKKLGLVSVNISRRENKFLDLIEEKIDQRFSVHVNVRELVINKLMAQKQRLPLYKYLLRKINPKLVVVVVSYGKEAFIEACKELDIPTVELQHGVIHKYHMGYSFPGTGIKQNFPDYLLAFGDYWKDSADFPIEDKNIYPVGYPYLESEKESYSGIEEEKQILFISQGTVGEKLSKFAVELNNKRNLDFQLVYKLHPGEFDRWQNEYPWLADSKIRVIKDEVPLYKLFAQSKVQVGVNSTALYEGLSFGLETFLLGAPGIEAMKRLIESNYADIVFGVEDFLKKYKNDKRSKNEIDVDSIFEPNSKEKMTEKIVELADL